ncbi:MAG TPA: hypothetical protein VF665_08145 [Longimicrobium sp.]|uniref:hypothetical protein n=1 Tax=Longimicrobium sp. TaxID=2029185 RepID=UPI002EDADAB2
MSFARRSFPVLLLLCLSLAPPAAAQARRPLAVRATGAEQQWRAVVLTPGVLRDRGLREALDSGLPLRFRLRAELWRKNEPFDQLAGAQEISRAVLRAPLGAGYVVEDGRVQRRYASLAAAEAGLQAAFAPGLRPAVQGQYYYIVRLEVETLSLSDLDELRRWLRGEAGPAVSGEQPVGRAVERGLRRVVVRLLGLPTRRYEDRTGVFGVR